MLFQPGAYRQLVTFYDSQSVAREYCLAHKDFGVRITREPGIKPQARRQLLEDLAENKLHLPPDYDAFLYDMNGMQTPGLRFLGTQNLSFDDEEGALGFSEGCTLLSFNLRLRQQFKDDMDNRLVFGEISVGTKTPHFLSFNNAPNQKCYEQLSRDAVILRKSINILKLEQTFKSFSELLDACLTLRASLTYQPELGKIKKHYLQ